MSRRSLYRARPSDAFVETYGKLTENKLFLVARNGPTVFSIKDEQNKTYKVTLGDPHICTCASNNNELCLHQIFCIAKVLRIPEKHPFCYQVGLTDPEITNLLSGVSERNNTRIVSKKKHDIKCNDAESTYVTRLELSNSEDDVCPICQDGMDSTQALAWCRKGCGQNIHAKCMQTFAQYKISNRDEVCCPLCRVPWLLEFLKEDCRKSTLRNTCKKVYCKGCAINIKRDTFYRCIECSQNAVLVKKRPVDFCANCFPAVNIDHKMHNFISSDPRDPIQDVQWSYVPNPRNDGSIRRNGDLLSVLQGRELTTEDYDLLLSLDDKGPQDIYTHVINALPIYMLGNYPNENKICWCKCDSTRNGIIYRTLPCGHVAHQDCLRTAMVRGTTDGLYCLGSLICSHSSCKQKIFHGLVRAKSSNPSKDDSNPDKGKKEKSIEYVGVGFDPAFQLAGTSLDVGLVNPSMSVKNITSENAGCLSSNQNIITSVKSIKQAVNNSLRHRGLTVRSQSNENMKLEGLTGMSLASSAIIGASTMVFNNNGSTIVKARNSGSNVGKLIKPQRINNNGITTNESFANVYSRGPFLNIVSIGGSKDKGSKDKGSNVSQEIFIANNRLSINSQTRQNSHIPEPPTDGVRLDFQIAVPNLCRPNRELVSNILSNLNHVDNNQFDELSVSSVTNAEPVYHGQSVIMGVDDHRLLHLQREGRSQSKSKSRIPMLIKEVRNVNYRGDDGDNDDDDDDAYEYVDDNDEFRFSRPHSTMTPFIASNFA